MVDVSGDLLGVGYLLTGVAAVIQAVRNGRKIKATSDKVDHVVAQVTTSNGHTLGELVEGNEARRLIEAGSGDLAASDGHPAWWHGSAQ